MRTYKIKLFRRPGREGWYGRYRLNKKWVIEKFGDTKVLAEMKQADVCLRLNNGSMIQNQNLTFDLMLDRYKVHLEAENVRPKTIYDYAQSLNRFKAIVGPLSSSQLSAAAIDRFKSNRKKQCKLVSVNTDLRAIRAFLNWLHKTKVIAFDIPVSMLQVPDSNPKAVARKVAMELLSKAEELEYHDLKLMVQIALSTGLRRSDIQNLAYADVDRKNGTITAVLRKTNVTVKISVSQELVKAIDNYVFQRVPKDWETIFHPKRLPLSEIYPFPDKRWETLREKAGLGKRGEGWDVAFKSFRSTAFSNMAEQGVPIEVVQKIAGHKSVTTTARYYMHISDARLKQVANIPNATEWVS